LLVILVLVKLEDIYEVNDVIFLDLLEFGFKVFNSIIYFLFQRFRQFSRSSFHHFQLRVLQALFYSFVVLHFLFESLDVGQKTVSQLGYDVFDLAIKVMVICFFKITNELFGRLQDKVCVILIDQFRLFVPDIFAKKIEHHRLIVFVIIVDVFELPIKLPDVSFALQ
jgi:hypothetical protein